MARAKTAEQNSSPPAASYMTTEQMDGGPDSPPLSAKQQAIANGQVQVIGGSLSTADHQMLYVRMRRGLARRLYEVWVTAGQLSGDKWEWANQSTRSQQAWVAVARATMGPAYQEQFGVREIAELMHG